MLGAKLLKCQPLPDKAEVAVTNFTARLRWAAFVLRLFARHLHFLNLTGFIRSSQAEDHPTDGGHQADCGDG
jgi:hypothetical protein